MVRLEVRMLVSVSSNLKWKVMFIFMVLVFFYGDYWSKFVVRVVFVV